MAIGSIPKHSSLETLRLESAIEVRGGTITIRRPQEGQLSVTVSNVSMDKEGSEGIRSIVARTMPNWTIRSLSSDVVGLPCRAEDLSGSSSNAYFFVLQQNVQPARPLPALDARVRPVSQPRTTSEGDLANLFSDEAMAALRFSSREDDQ